MKNTKQITAISMFAGLVVVLQVVATFINFGGFPITLTLIPIIIAGALYGPKIGALMGTVFGVVVNGYYWRRSIWRNNAGNASGCNYFSLCFKGNLLWFSWRTCL